MKTEIKSSVKKQKKVEHNEFLWGTFISVMFVGGIIVTMWILMWNLWLNR